MAAIPEARGMHFDTSVRIAGACWRESATQATGGAKRESPGRMPIQVSPDTFQGGFVDNAYGTRERSCLRLRGFFLSGVLTTGISGFAEYDA